MLYLVWNQGIHRSILISISKQAGQLWYIGPVPLHGEFLIRFTNSSDCGEKTILIKIIPIYCENYLPAPYRLSGIALSNRAVPE
ncbi:hypothetical protein [Akkermansia muciniphila]|uniref:hypothetical protein n=1 Tax=Akkermansia muciniphila TaxID=239935 RepID=UPI001968B7B4|nr:hypothetical protein [Akkermansia muciniphila]